MLLSENFSHSTMYVLLTGSVDVQHGVDISYVDAECVIFRMSIQDKWYIRWSKFVGHCH